MIHLELPPVVCPTCEGMGKWEDDDEDFGGSHARWITCDTCEGEGCIPADQAPDYEPPTLEEALDMAFAALRTTLATRIDWHVLSGHLSLSVRATKTRRWSRLVEYHQRRILSGPSCHGTTTWALWSIAQSGPDSTTLGDEYLVLDFNWPGLSLQ